MPNPFQNIVRTPGAPALTPREAAQRAALNRQQRRTSWPYYSKVKFFAQRVGDAPGPYAYAIPAGTIVRAFSYAVGENMVPGGFTLADGVATIADTNIQQRNQTIGGQSVYIKGLALQLLAAGRHLADGEAGPQRIRPVDALLAAAIAENTSVEVTLNADENRFRCGIPTMLPGGGGLQGQGPNLTGLQALGQDGGLGFLTNGWAVRANHYGVPEGLVWKNQSNADSQLNVVMQVQKQITIFSGGSPENNIAGSGVDIAPDNVPANVATGTQGYAYPSEIVCEFMVFLLGEVKGPRTGSA